MTTTAPTDWGPLAEPVHADAAGPGDPVWKDNAYLSFWNPDGGVFGTLHVSTSPNGEGARRARCSMSVAGRSVEVVEELPVGDFTSESIHFGLDGTVRVDHPEITLDLVNRPLFTPADFAANGSIPALVEDQPLQHYQQGTAVSGSVTVDGARHAVDARGMRDRTWGFRDESAQWVEYIGVVGVFEDRFLTVLKFLGADGSLAGDGFVVDENGSVPLADLHVTRDAAALFVSARLDHRDGGTSTVRATGRSGGFWVPMGREQEGQALGTYDDFLAFELDGVPGAGFVEQATLHRVF
ncbi:DUF7065 domain-containing protein [Actinomycetospora chibensis]|uniref:DUF7065 domain-containing protein n=1 Tax=Actinomycetospora chibensis TaxID=663606 RepID=A0ABV9RE90_9PSEU|nr:hypothetical protein [Actinomycetospora chibensis]MDD7925091.1 hypothetical protein [Actinomycetospora chibensis]